MFLLVVLAVAIVVALLRGGNLVHLASVPLRWRGVILSGFLIQVLIFSSFWQDRADTRGWTQFAYLLSLCLLVVALIGNRHIPGMTLLAAGLFLNFAAIAANGGYMPASPTAMQAAALRVLQPGEIANNSIGMGPDTRLGVLGDLFAIPHGIIFANVFSLGDVVIAVGAVYLIQKALVLPRSPTPAGPVR